MTVRRRSPAERPPPGVSEATEALARLPPGPPAGLPTGTPTRLVAGVSALTRRGTRMNRFETPSTPTTANRPTLTSRVWPKLVWNRPDQPPVSATARVRPVAATTRIVTVARREKRASVRETVRQLTV